MKRKNERFKTILAIVLWLVLVILLAIASQMNQLRSSKAQLYNSECLSEPIANPLKECKEELK